MALDTIILCTDGSDHAVKAMQSGFALLQPAKSVIVVTVIEPSDSTLVTGTGFAGGVVSPDEFDALESASKDEGQNIVTHAVADLGIENAEPRVLRGDPGPALCEFASEVGASAIVMGSRGRGGLKRALLGSVSDYVVRNATCPVVITGPTD